MNVENPKSEIGAPATAGHPKSEADAALARQVHGIVRDLLDPSPIIFWSDLLATLVVAYTALGFFLTAANGSLVQIVCCPIAGLALYRALIFTHELAHIRRLTFRTFRVVWNLLFGIPCMSPTFLYSDHASHHVNHSYGTASDGEYFPLALGPLRVVYAYLAQIFFVPVAAVVRFLLLAPVSCILPPLRKVVWQRASSLALINPRYRRPPLPDRREQIAATFQELGCFLVAAAVIGSIVTGYLPWSVLVKLYAVFVILTTVNYVRALGTHRYRNASEPMTYVEQLLDSTTIPGHPLLTELWAPLGMRYHALHHLVPTLPYHSMGKAHRRLMRHLPADSPYRATICSGLWEVIAQVYREAKAGSPQRAGG